MEKTERIKKLRIFLKNWFKENDILDNFCTDDCNRVQTFTTRNLCGDIMETIYQENGIMVDACYDWGYLEIFGMTKDEAESMCDMLEISNQSIQACADNRKESDQPQTVKIDGQALTDGIAEVLEKLGFWGFNFPDKIQAFSQEIEIPTDVRQFAMDILAARSSSTFEEMRMMLNHLFDCVKDKIFEIYPDEDHITLNQLYRILGFGYSVFGPDGDIFGFIYFNPKGAIK